MANLIIKSSADNLVLQGSDASPAITVGATGTTTFAENATLSGTANVYGEGSFPAGHVIGTEYMNYKTYKSYPNSTNWTTTGLTDSIVVKSQTSKILVQPKINIKVYLGAVSAYFRINESTTSLEVMLDDYWGNGSSAANTGTAYYQYLHDHNQSAGTTLTYTINMRPHTAHAHGIRVNDHQTANQNITSLVLMEIAQ